MSASHQLTEQQRTKLLTGHHLLAGREIVRYWLLSGEDVRKINECRREHNRFGFAIQLCLLRYPGWPLGPEEMPPPNLLTFVAEQLGADASEIDEYAARDETRREHLQLLRKEYRFGQYGPGHSSLLRAYLETEALSADSALTLVESAMEWLRERRVILPAFATLESLGRSVRSKVERDVYWRLFHRLEGTHKTELTKLLELGPSRGSLLGWLTDRSMDFHRRLIGRLFRESEMKQWTDFVQQGPSVNEKLHNYSRLTTVIAKAHKEGVSLESAIEKEFTWDALEVDGRKPAA